MTGDSNVPRRSLRSLARLKLGRGAWALADQGVVSLGNFLTTILLARLLPTSEYGAYALVYGTMIFLNNLHGAAIVYPLLTKGATSDESGLSEIVTDALFMSALLALGWGTVLGGITLALGRPWLMVWAAGALVIWQWQETLRRALMARMRHRDALFGDALSYLGQAALVWLLARGSWLSLTMIFVVVASTSALAGLVQLRQVGVATADIRRAGVRLKHFLYAGRWNVLGVFCSSFTSQSLSWILGVFQGAVPVARLQAVTNLVGATHLVMLSVGGLMIPAVAGENARAGRRAAGCTAMYHALQGAAMLLPYLAALALFPRAILQLVYGPASPYVALEMEARALALIYCLTYSTIVIEYFLAGLEQTQKVFRAQLVGSCLSLLCCAPLAAWGGLRWGLFGAGVAVTARLLTNLGQVWGQVYRRRPYIAALPADSA